MVIFCSFFMEICYWWSYLTSTSSLTLFLAEAKKEKSTDFSNANFSIALAIVLLFFLCVKILWRMNKIWTLYRSFIYYIYRYIYKHFIRGALKPYSIRCYKVFSVKKITLACEENHTRLWSKSQYRVKKITL